MIYYICICYEDMLNGIHMMVFPSKCSIIKNKENSTGERAKERTKCKGSVLQNAQKCIKKESQSKANKHTRVKEAVRLLTRREGRKVRITVCARIGKGKCWHTAARVVCEAVPVD